MHLIIALMSSSYSFLVFTETALARVVTMIFEMINLNTGNIMVVWCFIKLYT